MLNKIRLSIAYLNYCAKGTLTVQRNSIFNWQWGIASPHRPHATFLKTLLTNHQPILQLVLKQA